MHTKLAPAGATVTLDDRIIGCQSKTDRQLDITIRASVAQYNLLIVIECKDEARPLDVGTIGKFASLLQDVEANKGVMISTSGYTPAAIELARHRGIVTRTYIDTEGLDWHSELSISALIESRSIKSWQARFSAISGFEWDHPNDDKSLPLIETYAEDGTERGPIIILLGKAWHGDEALQEPGVQQVLLAEHALIDVGGRRVHTRIEATLVVRQSFHSGQLPVRMTGFRDEHDGSLSTSSLQIEPFEPAQLISGHVPGWVELQSEKEVAVKAMFRVMFVDALPETREEMARMLPLKEMSR
jgi:hypothetical protein